MATRAQLKKQYESIDALELFGLDPTSSKSAQQKNARKEEKKRGDQCVNRLLIDALRRQKRAKLQEQQE